MLECKIDRGSDSNLMPVNIFKVLFPKTSMVELAQHRNGKSHIIHILATHAFPQICVCRV